MPVSIVDRQTDLFGFENVAIDEAVDAQETIPESDIKFISLGHCPDYSLWKETPEIAFRVWKQLGRPNAKEFAPHSVEQYETMFRAFLRWLNEKGVLLSSARPEHLDLFLISKNGRDGKPAAATTRRRYLHLLHGVYGRLCDLQLRKDNPVTPLIDLTKNQDFEKPAPTLLSFELADRYIKWTLEQPEETWNQLRDKALRLIFLCSGITVAEAQDISPANCLTDRGDTKLEIRAHGFVVARQAPVSEKCTPSLLRWKAKLHEIDPGNQHLFPARICTIGHDLPDQTAVASAEAFLIVQEAMNAIGYDRARQGPQTLRNTFIAQQLWEGRPVEKIMSWCGLQTADSVTKIGKLVPVRRDGVAPA